MGRAQSLAELGSIAYWRFRDGKDAKRPAKEWLRHLRDAAERYEQALRMLPLNATSDLAVIHSALGTIYGEARQIEAAIEHFRQSVSYYEFMGDHFGAGATRKNAAIALIEANRLSDAREWALAALRDFKACGNADPESVSTAKQLADWIRNLPNDTTFT